MSDEALSKRSDWYSIELMIVAILAGVVWSVHFAMNFQGLWAPDAMEYADVARNIARGNGISTNSIWTMLLEKYHHLPFPSFLRPPLYPLLTAMVFKVTGTTEFSAVVVCGLAYVATVIPLFILVFRLFGRMAAWLAAVLYIFHNQSLYFSISGLTEPLATLFFMVFLCMLFLSEGSVGVLLAGAMLGLMQVTSDKAIPCFVVALGFLVVMCIGKRRWQWPALLVLGFVVVVTPFILYNLIHFGVLPYNKADPNVALMPMPSIGAANLRSLHPISAWTYATTYPAVLLNKFLIYFEGFTHVGLFGAGAVVSPYITLLALLGLFVKRPSEAVNRCYGYVLIALLVQIFALSFLYYVEARYLVNFAPALIGFAAGWFVWQVGQVSVRPVIRYAVAGLLLYLALDPVSTGRSLLGWGEFSEQYKSAGESAYVGRLLEEYTPPAAVVVTDVPWATAWYGQRTSILFPETMEDLALIDADLIPVDAVLLTTQMNTSFRSQFTKNSDARWRNLLERRPPRFAVGVRGKLFVYTRAESQRFPHQGGVLYVKKPTDTADFTDAFSKPPAMPKWIVPNPKGAPAAPGKEEKKP